MENDLPRMYTEFAEWWPTLSSPADYAEEAGQYAAAIRSACPDAKTLLELGCGGGNNASHMKADFTMTLVDRAPGMLAVSRRQNPECAHVEGDMRTVRLGQTFDAVFVHDAVMYMTTEDDLARAMETAFVHCRPSGAALFIPDCTRETFHPVTGCGGHDGEQRAMRYLEWTWDPDPDDTSFISDFAYMFREPDGCVHAARDRHIMGLFPRDAWLRLLEAAGFEARAVPFGAGDWTGEGFLGLRPAG